MNPAETQQVRAAYSTVAFAYEQRLPDTSFEDGVDLAMVQHFLAAVGAGAAARVLDAGCGAGRMLSYLHEVDPTLQLAGVDLAPGMVGRARANHTTQRIEEADLSALPFGEGDFDGVLSWYSVIHTPVADLAVVFAELRRVLRRDGQLLLGFHAGSDERRVRDVFGHQVDLTVRLHDPRRMGEALVAAGFEVTAQLVRAARPVERNPQAFVLATRL